MTKLECGCVVVAGCILVLCPKHARLIRGRGKLVLFRAKAEIHGVYGKDRPIFNKKGGGN